MKPYQRWILWFVFGFACTWSVRAYRWTPKEIDPHLALNTYAAQEALPFLANDLHIFTRSGHRYLWALEMYEDFPTEDMWEVVVARRASFEGHVERLDSMILSNMNQQRFDEVVAVVRGEGDD